MGELQRILWKTLINESAEETTLEQKHKTS